MDITTLWLLAVVLLLCGLLAGVIAGLLGVGGGIVLVPVLEYALEVAGFPPERCMHVAVATSLATIVPTAISSSRAHAARSGIDWDIAKAWAPGMLLGGLIGSVLASLAPSALLTAIFGSVTLLVALKMYLPLDHLLLRKEIPRGLGGNVLASAIGSISAMMGIGGGTLSVPAMIMMGGAIHKCVGTAAFFGLLLAVPGTIGYLLAPQPVPLPGLTVGLVSFAALALVAPTSFLAAPFGARLAHRLTQRQLGRIFALFLCVVGIRMLYRTFA
jgi:uncharacterized membrane protein YfcA